MSTLNWGERELAYDVSGFVSGKGHFVDDIKLPGMLHMTVLRSPYARARIVSLKGGMSSKDLKARMASVGEGASSEAGLSIEPVFATEFVNYVGEPVAAVFAEDRYKSADLLESIEVDYEPMKPVVTIDDALSMGPIHLGRKNNIMAETIKGADFKDPDSPIVIEDTLENERISANPIEPRGIVASFSEGMLNVWISTQAVHSIKEGLVESLGINPDIIRVMQTDTGGGFGSKGGLYPEYVIAAFASMKFGKPVKWIETRREHLSSTHPGRGMRGKVKLFAEKDGKITGLRGEVMIDAGAYDSGIASFSPGFVAMQMTGPYFIESAQVRGKALFTNKVPQGPYRGAGRPEASFLIERMVDMLADELKMDPADLRLMNMSEKPFTSPMGLKIDGARPFFESAVKELGYMTEVKNSKGVGLSFFVLVPAVYPGESARIIIRDGRVRVWLGGNSHGQGHEVFVKKLVNEELGVPERLVTLYRGDTGMTKTGVGSWGSRSAIVGGAAIVAVCRKIKEDVVKIHGRYSTESLLSGSYDEFINNELKMPLNSFGANLATVEIGKMGNVRIKKCVAFYDVGRALNPDMVIGQIQGGMAQGIGQTLHEGLFYNDEGQLITSSISDAGVPLAEDLPNFTVKIAENRSSLPHGAKGLGESPTIGVPTALIRAIEKASGKRLRRTPVTPEELIS
ncbi:MAG: xanthine dehydrogenase family protein molybdopterin-binding subunit [Candidatus Thermoplasmatota archaeon]|jgi:carbon-monoxide dehydrogenase large subunit|nr:xanthine dehydrogenase family protein molybdopterin-binding subunit [Candidatus Thermoplasmatota archaeon]